ncbi:hypothetical protein CR513_42159, partial [Mucuna pruriens]
MVKYIKGTYLLLSPKLCSKGIASAKSNMSPASVTPVSIPLRHNENPSSAHRSYRRQYMLSHHDLSRRGAWISSNSSLIGIDYFMKWIEVEPLANITTQKV